MSNNYIDTIDGKIKPKNISKLDKPKKFSVVILDDDFSSFDTVQEICENIFHLTDDDATSITLEVHLTGKSVVGTYALDIAETLRSNAMNYAKSKEEPLRLELIQME